MKNQSVQITGEDGLGSSLTAHEAATFYSSVMNTQQILNSRRQPKRFNATSNVGNKAGTANTAGGGGGASTN